MANVEAVVSSTYPDAVPGRIILVHGTILLPRWMPVSPWIREDSIFRRQLTAQLLTGEVVPFRWRGGNTHTERLVAARRLARVIDADDKPLLVIAHSHGGNVARMALQLARERSAPVRLVTVGTPFLNVRWFTNLDFEQRMPRVSWSTWWMFMWALVLCLVIGRSAMTQAELLGSDAGPAAPLGQGMLASMSFLALIGVAMAVVIAAAMLASCGVGAARVRGACRTAGLVEETEPGDVTVALKSIDLRHPRGALATTSVDAVAVENDEAAWALNLGQAAGSIGSALGSSARSSRAIGQLRTVLLVFTTVGVVLYQAFQWSGVLPATLRQSIATAASVGFARSELDTVLILLLIGFLLLTSVAGIVGIGVQMFEYASAGWDSLAFSGRARISVSTTPPGQSQATLLTITHTRSGPRRLRHSALFEDEYAVGEIVEIIRERVLATSTTALPPRMWRPEASALARPPVNAG